MSLTRMASSGSALSISWAARCGWIGVASSVKPGAMNVVPFLAIAVDGVEPFLSRRGARRQTSLRRVELGQHLAQERAHVRHQAERDRIVARDLVGIDVDVDELGRRDGERIAGQPRARGAVVEAHAERQQHVGLPRRVVGRDRRRCARRGRAPSGCFAVDGADAARRSATGICSRSASASRSAAAPPYFTPWPTRITGRSAASSMSTALFTPSGSAPQRDEMLAFHSSGFGVSSAAASLKMSNGTSSTTGPGPPGHHGLPRLPHRQRHHLAAGRLEHALAIGAHGRGKVGLVVAIELLERAAVELAGRHVAGHRQERHRIEKRVGERDRQVGRARTARREGRGRLAGDAVVDVGHEAGDGLVMHRDGLDVVRALVERVDELDVAVAAQAEHVGHLLADEIVDDDLAAVEHVLRPSGLLQVSARGGARRDECGRIHGIAGGRGQGRRLSRSGALASKLLREERFL